MAATLEQRRKRILRRIEDDPKLAEKIAFANSSYVKFKPRPDRPEAFDQQYGFCWANDAVSFLVGGNASGTTVAAAYKTAKFILERQPPPRRDTPFWIIAKSYEQTCSVCWGEKLHGQQLIPDCEVDWGRISWVSKKDDWPKNVPLKPWPGQPGKNWRIEFKSYEQGREALQARSIGGFWFSEQFPLNLFLETLRGCREYMFPGGQFCEFTPIDPELCLWIERVMEDPPFGWGFYRCNTELNKPNLATGWYENFFAAVPDEMQDVRKTGALASFEGTIFPSFQVPVHVRRSRLTTADIPRGVWHYRGIDWGSSVEHPFTCVWGYVDGQGHWTIYDEYWSISQAKLTRDHAAEILDRSIAWGWPEEGNNPEYCQTYADPARPDLIGEFSALGIPCLPANNDVYDGIDTIRMLLKVQANTGTPKLMIHERCRHLNEEMRKYRWKRTRLPQSGVGLISHVAKPEPLRRDEDTVCAMRYMIHSVTKSHGLGLDSMKYSNYERKSVQIRRNGNGKGMLRMAGL